MRYAIVAAALIASVAAVPVNRPEGPWGGRPDDDCEVSWVVVDPEPTSSLAVSVDPISTTKSSAVVEPAVMSSAETTWSRPHWSHGPHTGAWPTSEYEPTTTMKSTHKATTAYTSETTTEPIPTLSTTMIPSTTVIPSTSAAPSTTPEETTEPTSAGSTPFPYPSPTPTQITWTGDVNSAAHATSYTDPATATTEAQCTAAAPAYISAAVDGHNAKRTDHQANPVVWDDNLSCVAQRQAGSCLFDHLTYVNGGGYGQNLAGGTDTTIEDSISMWYDEAPDYDSYYGESDPPFVAGHFTQMVWASTTSIGCATYECDGSVGTFTGALTVCNYWEFGNMGGAYAENVLPADNSSSSGR